MDLGVIGNCAVAALVSREGAINWFCLPRFDGDPVFHSLMGHGAGEEGDGEFAVELEDMTESEQSYLPNTAILRTVLRSAKGAVEIVDFCPRFTAYGRSSTKTDGGLGEGTADLATLGVYGGYTKDRYHLDGSLSVGYGWSETDRVIALPGLLRTAKGETEGLTVQSRIALGATYDVSGWSVGPEAWVGYTGLQQKGYTETGAGSLNARVDELWLGEVGTGLGVTVGRGFDLGGPVLMPAVTLGMGYRSPTGDDSMTGVLGGTAAGAYNLDLARENELTFDPVVEAVLAVDGSTSAYASWRGRFGDGVADQAGTVGVRITW